MNTLVFRAVDRRGAFSPACKFMISTDEGQTFTPAQQASAGHAYASIPLDELARVTVYAIPDDPRYWPESAVFEVLPDGAVACPDSPREFFSTMGTLRSGRDTVTVVHFHLSIFRDASERLLEKLRNPPPDRWEPIMAEPTWGQSWVSSEPGLVPIVTEQVVSGDSVAFAEFAYAPGFDVRVLERKGDQVVPKYFAVAWPRALPRDEGANPTPFLVFFTHQLAQNINVLPYLKQYPDGWDYLYTSLYRYLNFMGNPLDAASDGPYTRGLLPQIAASGKNLVLVLPVPNANDKDAELGDALDAGMMEAFLLEIQSFFFKEAGLFRSPNPYIGRVALGAFSSGNNHIPRFLSRHRNASHRFRSDALREVYCFDTKSPLVTGWADAALRWASTGKEHTGKMIRMYGTNPGAYAPVHQAFFSKPGPAVAPYVSTHPMRTIAVLPESSWRRAVAELSANDEGQIVHQLICGSMLTDALRRSGF
ncbi:hypothetical protein [Polyangium jinanense]|uniref:Uncharacterized protein n=1 Tax=Polyangium jinanense TaxID=2829994 RepID=A0A9X4AXG8_9BACT|nr:hypothetical protein [Polyangium jinanense]MDC3960022.1 hypothetical protein [Polyangium jinanense]MDC3986240.1 hypothetical protein [Polyangium jinanense]